MAKADSTNTESPEQKAIKACYQNVVLCLQSSTQETAVKLKTYNLISPAEHSFVKNHMYSDYEKAVKIADCVQNQL